MITNFQFKSIPPVSIQLRTIGLLEDIENNKFDIPEIDKCLWNEKAYFITRFKTGYKLIWATLSAKLIWDEWSTTINITNIKHLHSIIIPNNINIEHLGNFDVALNYDRRQKKFKDITEYVIGGYNNKDLAYCKFEGLYDEIVSQIEDELNNIRSIANENISNLDEICL